jgi:hypothetical protein
MSTTATTVAISAAANAQAAAANAAAQEAARKACMAYVRGYEHDRANVTEMREYAGCIDRLHPAPLEPGDLMAWKIVVAVLLVGMAVGAVREWRDSYSSGPIEAVLMGGMLGLCVSGGGVLLVAGVWFGARLLLA